MMSFFDNQDEIDRKPTADQSLPGIEQDFGVSSAVICEKKDADGAREELKASSPADVVVAVDSGASDDMSLDSFSVPSSDGVFLEENREVEDKARVESTALQGRTELSEIDVREIRVSDDSRDFFVVESSEKQGILGENVVVEREEVNEKGFDSGVVETSVDHELSAYSCDSHSLDSSDMFSETGSWMHGFEKGDMVWGKVKSHPWWPGVIFDESLASLSVRRTKREGYVLVAFFGDCSYGWFDPAELVPFDSYFEKSKQTGSRNFVKAVEEAVGEAVRRRSLALTCRCHNKFNFRSTSVPGYFSVDVLNSEFGGVYSTRQIEKARDGFVPLDVISFLKELSLAPNEAVRGTMNWIRNMSQLISLRKAMFEEFDETYAQAFGVEPLRPTQDALVSQEQSVNQTTRAALPLSGRLVIAEALREKRKGSVKSAVKGSKDKSKKDKYLFKRRDDAPSSSPDSPSLLGIRPTDFVPKQEEDNVSAHLDSTNAGTLHKVPGVDDYVLQKRQPADGEVEAVADEIKVETPGFADQEVLTPFTVGQMIGDRVMMPNAGVVVKKEKKRQRKEDGGGQVMMFDAVTKKKRKKKDLAVESVLGHPSLNPPKVGRQGGDVEEIQIGVPLPDNSRLELSKTTDVEYGRPMTGIHDVATTVPSFDLKPHELDTRLLSNDLSALALDPFHGRDRNASVIVRYFFLRFRNLVYQKSLVLPSASESDRSQIQSGKSDLQPASVWQLVGEGEARGGTIKTPKQVKRASKAAVRSDDPTKSGRKRAPSDRQEQILVKRVKKISQLKELASEKRAAGSQKPSEGGKTQENVKVANSLSAKGSKKQNLSTTTTITTVPKKKETVVKKQEEVPAPRVVSPTFLFMKFPSKSTLPNIASMKARFGRFGPLDLSGARVYWGSYTCKLLFKYRVDAQTAYMYARNNPVFGPFKVNYSLRDADMPEPTKNDFDDNLPSRRSDTLPSDVNPSALKSQQIPVQSSSASVQLKSCLKKPNGDDTVSAVKETPRVKFLLDNNTEGGKSEPSSSSLPPTKDLNVNGKNLRSTSFPPTHTPPHPPPSQLPSRVSKGPSHVDISYEMLNLLRRCSDIVTNVRSAFGYVPYHAL